ncbi:MAG: prolipoprotein diacylglyceryl transferase [Planctomycetota bacterium]|nr:MAG: prolipoprotein diacylglyceryl transferase [Planctomycetota bacterium]
MHPILFEIPGIGFPVRSFGVAILLGVIVGHWVMHRLFRRFGEKPGDADKTWDLAMWVLVGAILGARVLYVIVEVSKYWSGAPNADTGQLYVESPLKIFAIWEGGLVMYGGFFGAVLLGIRAARKAGLRLAHALDLGLIGGFVGQGIGRWGCYLVGDDYGSVVPAKYEHLPFPITLRVPPLEWLQTHPASLFEHELAGKVLWATQIWESANAFVVALVAYLVLRKRRYAGQCALWVFATYALLRFLVEIARGDAVRGVWFGGTLSTSQLISLPVALLAFGLLWRYRNRTEPARA